MKKDVNESINIHVKNSGFFFFLVFFFWFFFCLRALDTFFLFALSRDIYVYNWVILLLQNVDWIIIHKVKPK